MLLHLKSAIISLYNTFAFDITLTEAKDSSDPENTLYIINLELFTLLCIINCSSFCSGIGTEYQGNSHLDNI